jgi:tRNA U34 5-carboxymethylaminomethyl modifying GTPase MnmE/TrmE
MPAPPSARRWQREGFKVVLAGPPNVGKSSLLNALARRAFSKSAAEGAGTA